MKQLPIAPQATAFVSDTVEDLVDAKVAGITTIALVHPTSYNSAAKFRKYGPDYTVHDFRALRRLVIELAK